MNHKTISVLRLLLTCGIFLLAACQVVYSTKPVGKKPFHLDVSEWDGNWRGSDGVISLKVKDAEHGILDVAWIEEMELNSYRAYLLESENWVFFNFKPAEEGDDGYLWGRIKKQGNSIILWHPKATKFTALVKQGTLPGEVRKTGEKGSLDGDVILGELSAEHLQIITSSDKDVLFDWENPLFLIKLSD